MLNAVLFEEGPWDFRRTICTHVAPMGARVLLFYPSDVSILVQADRKDNPCVFVCRQLALRDLETRTSLGSAPSTPRGPAGGALPAEAAATAPLNNATAATD